MLKKGGLELPQILSLAKIKFLDCRYHDKLVFHQSIFRILNWYLNGTVTL